MSEFKNDTEEQEVTEEKSENKSNKTKIFKGVKIKSTLKHSIGFVAGLTIGFVLAIIASIGVYDDNAEYLETIASQETTIQEQEIKLSQAKPWFKMELNEQKKIEEQNEKVESERLAAEKQQAEKDRTEQEKKAEEERLAKEQEEKKGYDTGITYSDLARNPKDHVGEKVKFKGEVIQVMEGDSEVQIRLAVNGDSNNVIYCVYDSSLVDSRVLEDDYITVMGLSSDVITYDSTMGGSITIPSMLVQKIDM
jgi:hypothetical protein